MPLKDYLAFFYILALALAGPVSLLAIPGLLPVCYIGTGLFVGYVYCRWEKRPQDARTHE
jgi:hypothetical protein